MNRAWNVHWAMRTGSAGPFLCLVVALLVSTPALATTWYVRADGGTRYSTNVPNGQCDGKGDEPYPGKGVNQHCAFNDIRLLWQDGSYAYAPPASTFPAAGWVGKGGDTYIVRGSIAIGTAPYRVGWSTSAGAEDPNVGGAERGWHGNPFNGPPSPPAGTADHHTRILGENWQKCHGRSARTPVIGGHNVGAVFDFNTSYVDLQCFDISDASECKDNCNGADSASEGIGLENTADHLTLTDIRIHGMQGFGILGPSGNGSVFTYLSLIGNGGGGWNADAGNEKTGVGSLLVQHYEIKWNGCAEEYPIIHSLPYKNCTDQSHGGYGDGFGTATVASPAPGWQVHFDQGEVAYNTQDGLDALHLIGNRSSMTITRTLAYGNMGQQIKVGGAAGKAVNNLIVGNCWAMSFPIPGTPPGFNAKLSDYCRAGDQAVVLTVGRGAYSRFENNTLYAAGNIGIDIECDGFAGDCDNTSRLSLQNNIIVGFPNSPEHGNKGSDGRYPTAVYNNTTVHPFTNRGSVVRNNTIFHQRNDEPCTIVRSDKTALCTDPKLHDSTYYPYGYGDMRPTADGPSAGSGIPISDIQVDFEGSSRLVKPSRGALEPNSSAPKQAVQDGMSGDTKGDKTGGGGGNLQDSSSANISENSYGEEEPAASSEAPMQISHHVPHGLLRPAIVCVAVISGAGLFLLGRATSRGEG